MMNTDSFLDDVSHGNDRRKHSIFLLKNFKRSVVDLLDSLLFSRGCQVIFGAN